jgi:hypothetical protein
MLAGTLTNWEFWEFVFGGMIVGAIVLAIADLLYRLWHGPSRQGSTMHVATDIEDGPEATLLRPAVSGHQQLLRPVSKLPMGNSEDLLRSSID